MVIQSHPQKQEPLSLKLFKVKRSSHKGRLRFLSHVRDGSWFKPGHSQNLLSFREFQLQRVPALRGFWDLEKTVLHEIRVSGTVLWSPTNANSPTYTYISQKSCQWKPCQWKPCKWGTPCNCKRVWAKLVSSSRSYFEVDFISIIIKKWYINARSKFSTSP